MGLCFRNCDYLHVTRDVAKLAEIQTGIPRGVGFGSSTLNEGNLTCALSGKPRKKRSRRSSRLESADLGAKILVFGREVYVTGLGS
jgi:hypothetical protein